MGVCNNFNNNDKENEINPIINRNEENNYYNKFYCCLKNNFSEPVFSFFFNKKEEPYDKEKFSILKNQVLERRKNSRQKKKEILSEIVKENEIEENKEINQVLEDMCIYGNVVKKQIKEEKEKNPENFIEINDALNLEEQDQQLFALGLLANNMQKNGIEVAIEKKIQDN